MTLRRCRRVRGDHGHERVYFVGRRSRRGSRRAVLQFVQSALTCSRIAGCSVDASRADGSRAGGRAVDGKFGAVEFQWRILAYETEITVQICGTVRLAG